MRLLVLLCALACLANAPALADGAVLSKMTDADKAKLAAFDSTRAEALAQARAGGDAKDVAQLERVMAGKAMPLREKFDMRGAWRCRTMKLGKTAPALVVYPWFSCAISEDGAGLWLDKTGGSQRTRGLFYDDRETRLIYLGALHYGDEQPTLYGADARRNQVGYVFRTGEKRLRIEFPAPEFESLLDVMELERR